jgi:hypothetical protein
VDAPGVAGGPHARHRLVARDDFLALDVAARLGPHLRPSFEGLGMAADQGLNAVHGSPQGWLTLDVEA